MGMGAGIAGRTGNTGVAGGPGNAAGYPPQHPGAAAMLAAQGQSNRKISRTVSQGSNFSHPESSVGGAGAGAGGPIQEDPGVPVDAAHHAAPMGGGGYAGPSIQPTFSADMDLSLGSDGHQIAGQMYYAGDGSSSMGMGGGGGPASAFYSPPASPPYTDNGPTRGVMGVTVTANNGINGGGNGGPRQELLANEYNHLINAPNSIATYGNKVNPHYNHYQEAQFIADLCINYEEISVKKKRVTNIPPVLCQNIAEITSLIAESIANVADFEMVQLAMANVAGSLAITDLKYDENFVVNRRQSKMEEFLDLTTSLVSNSSNQVGMIRLDARTLFFSLLKKALEMFLTKHNQVTFSLSFVLLILV
jgi:hypothetical protein